LSSTHKNLSSFSADNLAPTGDWVIGIVVSEWNAEITEALYDGAYKTLIEYGVNPSNILKHYVPGSFELTLGGQYIAEYTKADAIICLGCVIQGETKHFDFICNAVADGITNLNIKYNKPFIFGVLTPENQQQAIDRAGGKHGNKGDEAAITALKMLSLQKQLQ
jgi:6,7-dimethyl-8-ribityllumazine synthase